jgi:hypothetical protein
MNKGVLAWFIVVAIPIGLWMAVRFARHNRKNRKGS